jgi:hypothetical protein
MGVNAAPETPNAFSSAAACAVSDGGNGKRWKYRRAHYVNVLPVELFHDRGLSRVIKSPGSMRAVSLAAARKRPDTAARNYLARTTAGPAKQSNQDCARLLQQAPIARRRQAAGHRIGRTTATALQTLGTMEGNLHHEQAHLTLFLPNLLQDGQQAHPDQ